MIIRSIAEKNPSVDQVVSAIREYKNGWIPSIEELGELYRTADKEDAIYRIAGVSTHQERLFFPIAKYITKIITNYTLGEAPLYGYHTEEDEQVDVDIDETLNAVKRLYRRQSIRKHDNELKLEAGKYGFAYEIVYVDDQDNLPRTKLLPADSTLVVFSDDFRQESLFAVTWLAITKKEYKVFVYTENESIVYRTTALYTPKNYEEIERQPHYFERVPVTMFKNNSDLRGDYEGVRVLIQAYNDAMTDVKFDIKRCVDGLMIFYNTKLAGATPEEKAKVRNAMRELGILELEGDPDYPQMQVDVKTMSSNLNIANTDIFLDKLWKTIFRLSFVPDPLQTEYFTSLSGVALKMQQFLGLEPIAKDTEAEFDFGLKRRFKLYNSILNKTENKTKVDVGDLEIKFKHTAVNNDMEVAQMISMLYGKAIASNETLSNQLSFVGDAQAEVEKAASESTAQDSSAILSQLSTFNG